MNDLVITLDPRSQIGIVVLWLICSALATFHFFTEGRRRLIIPCPTPVVICVTPLLLIGGPVSLMAAVFAMYMVGDMRAQFSPETVAKIEEAYRARRNG